MVDFFICPAKQSSPFMIDLFRLKSVGAWDCFMAAICNACDKRFQAHCRKHSGQVTFLYYTLKFSINELYHRKVALCQYFLHFSDFYTFFNAAKTFLSPVESDRVIIFVLRLHNASRDRKNETGAGVAQARPVIRPVFPRRRTC